MEAAGWKWRKAPSYGLTLGLRVSFWSAPSSRLLKWGLNGARGPRHLLGGGPPLFGVRIRGPQFAICDLRFQMLTRAG